MHVHILGICGTFMGGLALLAREAGLEVTGSDAGVYPPMSDQLERAGIQIDEGYKVEQLDPAPDLVIIGNGLSRGNPCVERVLNQTIPFMSGPQWLADVILPKRHVLAVSGTHGKTTTTSMLAWILDYAGRDPGFLIGGVAENFGKSARSGNSNLFVVEADEYDTAFFDKRAKFIHYRPRTLIINNIEFDHADIFSDLQAIKREFHHLVRIAPANGRIIVKAGDHAISDVLAMGCWTATESFGQPDSDWRALPVRQDYSSFEVTRETDAVGTVEWDLVGSHNMENALAAIAAANQAGVAPEISCSALGKFKSVKRRLECLGEIAGVTVYDDFAHHPTAIKVTLEALRRKVGGVRIIAVMEPRSNTMRSGVHGESLPQSLAGADMVLVYQARNAPMDFTVFNRVLADRARVFTEVAGIIDFLAAAARAGDHILIMSNGGFEGIHTRLLERLRTAAANR
ncbi:MAG: UDP-N-acetylmuramate:L-alanyl-gamma-D-glutamyl-meso-diaminopimelate ligase [Gammaproteobacteria bacterium]|nr:MAG: UDP-N-acetylmuramate:L-alanyl-gamma-D-glutamyl-meso-diaminopimelate ligase [Gammaproteobacteria bacterium]